MTKQTPIDAVNRLMNALSYSVASYLRFSRPWVDASAQSIADAIERVAQGHRQHATRIGQLLVERHGHVAPRTFPTAFAGLNDLSIEYLLPLVIEDEKQILDIVQAMAVALEHDAEALALVARVFDSEKRHLQILESAFADRRSMRSDVSVQARYRTSNWPASNTSRQPRIPTIGRTPATRSPDETLSRQHLTPVLLPGGASPC